MLEVADDGQDLQIGIGLPQAGGRLLQRRGADVDGDVGRQIGGRVQHDARLLAGARAELDQHGVGAEAFGPARGDPPQQRRLLPGRIVFRQAGDGLEQLRPARVIEPFGRQALGRRRQARDQVAAEGLMLVIGLVASGRVAGIGRQADAREGPALIRVEEVAIGRSRVPRRRGEGAPAQHHLIGHELAVVLGRRALGRSKAGVRAVGAGGPLPRLIVQVGEGVGTAAGGVLPFRLGGQTPAGPPRKGVGLIEADMAHRRGRIHRPPPRQGHDRPARPVLSPPIERRGPAARLDRRPAVAQPQFGPGVAAVIHEGQPVAIDRQVGGQGERLKPDSVRRPFVVEGEPLLPRAGLDKAPLERLPASARRLERRMARLLIIGRRVQRRPRHQMQKVHQKKLLMLLLVVQAQFK
ncbi:hypothetical protein D3C73_694830 [compost metagenome]